MEVLTVQRRVTWTFNSLSAARIWPRPRGTPFERANPVTGELVTRSAAAGPEDAIRAVDAAAAAFPAWSGLGPNARRRILLKAAEVLLSKMDEFKGLMAAETGITAGIAENEVRIGADMLVEAASLTTQVGGEIIPSEHPGTLSLAVRQKAGVCVGIAPWNGPISLGVRAIAVALACGNTVILKGSSGKLAHSPGGLIFVGAEGGFVGFAPCELLLSRVDTR